MPGSFTTTFLPSSMSTGTSNPDEGRKTNTAAEKPTIWYHVAVEGKRIEKVG